MKAVVDNDGAVLLDLKRGQYFAMNDVAAHIWRDLEAGVPRGQLCSSLTNTFDIDERTAKEHVDEFLTSLVQSGLAEDHA